MPLIIFVFIFFLSTFAHANEHEIRIGLNSNPSFPYILGSDSKLFNPPGISVEIIQQALNTSNLKAEYQRMPGLRVLKRIKDQSLDAAVLFSHTPERASFSVYPKTNSVLDPNLKLATLTYSFFKSRNTPLPWDGRNFKNIKGHIGANTGYSIVKHLRSKGIIVEEANSTKQNIHKLLANRIVGVADQDIVMEAHLSQMNIEGIGKVYPSIITKDYYLIFSQKYAKENPEKIYKIWHEIGKIRDDMTRDLLPTYLSLPNIQ